LMASKDVFGEVWVQANRVSCVRSSQAAVAPSATSIRDDGPIAAVMRSYHGLMRECAIASSKVGVCLTAVSTPYTARSARLGDEPPRKGRLGPTASMNVSHSLQAVAHSRYHAS
jgi:hypothetical protein